MTVDRIGNRFMCAGALIAPALAVVGVRFISPSPQGAVAATPVAGESPIAVAGVTPEVALSPQQATAREMSVTPVDKNLASPFLSAPDPEAPVSVPVESAAAEPEPSTAHGPMVLTSIFAGRKTVAIINGKVRHVGDEVEPGWRVTAIEASSGVVTVENRKRESLMLRVHRLRGGAGAK